MATTLSPAELRHLARIGAQARLEQIRQEKAALLSAFPELSSGSGAARVASAPRAVASNGVTAPNSTAKPRQKYNMSAAQRQVVSLRMKKYWAARRREKAAAAGKK